MAGLLDGVIREWVSSPSDPHPCGHLALEYAAKAAERELPPLPRTHNRAEVVAALRPFGGLVGGISAKMALMGIPVTDAPVRGDVGIIDAPTGRTCGIYLGGGKWLVKGNGFANVHVAAPIIAWRV